MNTGAISADVAVPAMLPTICFAAVNTVISPAVVVEAEAGRPTAGVLVPSARTPQMPWQPTKAYTGIPFAVIAPDVPFVVSEETFVIVGAMPWCRQLKLLLRKRLRLPLHL